ncbi:hypothetical protein BDV28DRAFT_63234 [Aspergillus coremiiformis]|uniref:Uncharacterized protein n=1 Tax=Aspergillus coremiiformis TaxID=138285 RepID=A0A5N6YV04_9EURO|nr:hypothetical protein BDV28DRAFT_63234 [Aspergillus coremiiformis]
MLLNTEGGISQTACGKVQKLWFCRCFQTIIPSIPLILFSLHPITSSPYHNHPVLSIFGRPLHCLQFSPSPLSLPQRTWVVVVFSCVSCGPLVFCRPDTKPTPRPPLCARFDQLSVSQALL